MTAQLVCMAKKHAPQTIATPLLGRIERKRDPWLDLAIQAGLRPGGVQSIRGLCKGATLRYGYEQGLHGRKAHMAQERAALPRYSVRAAAKCGHFTPVMPGLAFPRAKACMADRTGLCGSWAPD